MLPDFYQVLKGFRGLYWVLLGFTRFFWVLLKFLPGFTGFYRVSQGFLQQCSLDLTGSLWIVPSFTDITGFYWVLPSLTNLRTDPNWKRSSDSSCLAISCSRTAVHLSTSNEKKNIKKKTKKETREKKTSKTTPSNGEQTTQSGRYQVEGAARTISTWSSTTYARWMVPSSSTIDDLG